MSALEARLKVLEDRLALQDVLTAYCTAVDSLSDMDGLLNCFTEDALVDLSGIGLPRLQGHEEIRGFFEQVFTHMTHHGHYATNLTVDRLEDDRASCRAYVIGMGLADDGRNILVYVRYYLDFLRTPDGWKMYRFSEDSLMPLPKEVSEVHTPA